MNAISFWLPFPPSVNNLFSQGFVNGRMRRFPSAKYKSWRKHAWLVIKAAKLPRFTVPVDLTIELVAPDKRPRDADNHNKGIVDSLVENGVLQGDDQRYVRSVHAVWIDHPEKGWAKVTITPVSGAGAVTALPKLRLSSKPSKPARQLDFLDAIKQAS